ncbi:MAG: PEP/pyruvate-binding domain-containing protein [Desulfovibrionaceae bacterium]
MGKLTERLSQLLEGRRKGDKRPFTDLFSRFRRILELNNSILSAIASMSGKLGGDYIFDRQYIRSASAEIMDLVGKLIFNLQALAPGKYAELNDVYRSICSDIEAEASGKLVIHEDRLVLPYADAGPGDQEALGAKSARLAEIGNTLGLATPPGFAATTRAYRLFMERNRLDGFIAELERRWLAGELPVESASEEIQALILESEVPARLRKALAKAVGDLFTGQEESSRRLAVRSSALGEDGRRSFAGQYVTLLNQTPENAAKAYVQVLAGTYSARAMEYRRSMGFAGREIAMAVAFQAMIPARASGVAYSLSPQSPESGEIIISSIWGLGGPLVSGEVEADRFTVSRQPPYNQTSVNIVRKTRRWAPLEPGSVGPEPVQEELQTLASLSADEVRLMAETAMRLERYFKRPQDIEYAFDREGRLYILQTRPLQVDPAAADQAEGLCESLQHYPVIMSGVGEAAQKGIATGPVFIIRDKSELPTVPKGAVLVARRSSPSFGAVIHRIAGVVTDVGSTTGHMATLAREFRVPALVNTGEATWKLRNGQMVTLDAEQKTVYLGQAKELCLHELVVDPIEESYEYRMLRRVLNRIEPLTLINPSERNFTPAGCKTLHDITRFIHEKAVEQLINANHANTREQAVASGRLNISLPLDIVVIDIGGGLSEQAAWRMSLSPRRRMDIEPEQVVSRPMRAFIEGVRLPGVWSNTPVDVDFSSFMSSLTRTFAAHGPGSEELGKNLAVISECYAHINLHLGYHFSIINCYISENKADNYAYFRFAGGVTGAARRSRRAQFLVEVLKQHDFFCTSQGDLVVGRIKKFNAELILDRVRVLGMLVGYTRQLDVSMVSDAQIKEHVDEFGRIAQAASSPKNGRPTP